MQAAGHSTLMRWTHLMKCCEYTRTCSKHPFEGP
jgi:hypothetical protein